MKATLSHWFTGLLRCTLLALVLAGSAGGALAAKIYTDNGDGTVTDPTTGLIWLRCAQGQTWTGATCTGLASTHTWDQASALTGTVTFAGSSEWRLPNIRELQTIVERDVGSPAIGVTSFPGAESIDFWSSTPSAVNASDFWYVDFLYGYSGLSNGLNNGYAVRLVRGGEAFGLLDTTRPSTDYLNNANGTITHIPTMLMWQTCAVGQTWENNACTGAATRYMWDDTTDTVGAHTLFSVVPSPEFAGKKDWRLPTEDELLSLVDYSQYTPAINTSLFPNTPSTYFWSDVKHSVIPDRAWSVYFGTGSANVSGRTNIGPVVRLVRDARGDGPFRLAVIKTGAGKVTSAPFGIDCGLQCAAIYDRDTVVTLNATPSTNFVAWGGACSTTTATTCVVTMSQARTVSATFVAGPYLSGLPSALAFGLQNIGSTGSQTVTLVNTGTTDLAISTITATSGSDFSVSTSAPNNCIGSLAPNTACKLVFSFSPTVKGARTGSITVTSNAPGSPQTAALTGTGQGGALLLSPTSLTFSAIPTGTSSPVQTVTVSNVGGAAVNFTSIAASGEFSTTHTCGTSIQPGTSCSVSVTFSPLTIGLRQNSLTITSDADNGATRTVDLIGTGLPSPTVSLVPASLSFPPTAVNTSSAPLTVKLTNIGTATLSLSAVSIAGDFLLTHNCGTGVQAGANCTLSVVFKPVTGGALNGSLTVTTNAPTSPEVVQLTGSSTLLPQTIDSFAVVPTSLLVGETATASASASSGLGVSFATATPSICSVSVKTITALAIGTCTITASQVGNAVYDVAPTRSTSVFVKSNQTIQSFGFTPATLQIGGTSTVSASASSGLEVTFSSDTGSICSVTGNTVKGLALGVCIVRASQAGNSSYNAAPATTKSITVGQGSQSIGSVTFNPSTVAIGGTATVSAKASSLLAVAFTTTTGTACSVSSSVLDTVTGVTQATVTGLATGTCIIVASQAGDANFLAATSKSTNITVGKSAQTISSISFLPTSLSVGGTAVASASATSGLPVTFSLGATAAICSLTGNQVKALMPGTCTIVANQAGNASFAAAAPVSQNLDVSAMACTLTASPTEVRKGGSSTLTANCTPAATSWVWEGACAGNTTANCTVTPAATTDYSVTGSNGAASGTATARVLFKPFDITPILMLLLD